MSPGGYREDEDVMMMNAMLVGNAFPLSLIRRPVLMTPVSKRIFTDALVHSTIVSFWGHQNTLKAAKQQFGVDLTPDTERPAIQLNEHKLPVLKMVFDTCWVISPDYIPGFRPAVGEEVPPEAIQAWQVIKIEWQHLRGNEGGRF